MKREMETFEHRFAELLSGSVVPMDEVLCHVGAVRGKRLRPRLVFLAARLFGEISESTRLTALFVELLHTASLIHDDVVDEAVVRRGQPSVNARWNNKVAVLAGDYLLSKAMLLLSDPSDHLILQEMLQTSMSMSEGELLQLSVESSALGVGSEATQNYIDLITRKTARLVRACCVAGAMSVLIKTENESCNPENNPINLLGDFGLNLGLVFQMRDDILDNDDSEITEMAEQLLPEYLKKALEALEALTPLVTDREALSSLRELAVFCAERTI